MTPAYFTTDCAWWPALLATLDRRYRVVTRRREAPTVAASPSRRAAATGNSPA